MQQGNPETRSKTVSRLCCQCIEDWTQKTNWFIIYSLAKYHAFCLLIGRAGYNSEFWFLVEMQACPCLSMWATLNANIALEINKIYSLFLLIFKGYKLSNHFTPKKTKNKKQKSAIIKLRNRWFWGDGSI